MAKCKNCGHNSAHHHNHEGKSGCCIECKDDGKMCKGWEE